MIKNKNTNNKVCVLSDTDRKAVKVMSKENNAKTDLSQERYTANVKKEMYRKFWKLYEKLDQEVGFTLHHYNLLESRELSNDKNYNTIAYHLRVIKDIIDRCEGNHILRTNWLFKFSDVEVL